LPWNVTEIGRTVGRDRVEADPGVAGELAELEHEVGHVGAVGHCLREPVDVRDLDLRRCPCSRDLLVVRPNLRLNVRGVGLEALDLRPLGPDEQKPAREADDQHGSDDDPDQRPGLE